MKSVFALFTVILLVSISTVRAKGVSRCAPAEEAQLQIQHQQCTRQVEDRYAVLAGKFETHLPSPLRSAKGQKNLTNERDAEFSQLCNLLHDLIEKCGRIYQKCLDEEQYRHFLDAQLEIFIQLMSRLYNMGGIIHQCEAVQEYERSGRREILQSTEKCQGSEVQHLTIKYQQCVEDANIDMTQQMIGHHEDYDLAFQSLCDGIDKVVHGCGDMLIECYTQEQLEETKMGQLEMTRKVFKDIMEKPEASSSHLTSSMKFDVGECAAYKSIPRSSAIRESSNVFKIFSVVLVLSWVFL